MPSTIKIKRSSVAGKIPTTSDIATGELALNTKDQKLYSSNGTGVFQIGGGGGESSGDPFEITTSSIKDLTQNDTVVTNVSIYGGNTNTLVVANPIELTTSFIKDLTQNDTVVTSATIYSGNTITLVDNGLVTTQANRITLVNTNLTGTNTALRTLISDRLQVANAIAEFQTKTVERAALANTNASIATQANRITLVNTNLTSTNTALRTLISDRLQVANAATIYQTKAIERAALANTNASIATQATRVTLVNTNLKGTNTALRTLISDRLQVSNSFSSLTVRSANTAALTTAAKNTTLNDALVVNPAGHLQLIIGGVTYKVPYFL